MITITYAKLTTENFNEHSLDTFKRYQEVAMSLRKLYSEYVYIDNPFIEDWDLAKRRNIAKDIIIAINKGAIAYGAFCNHRIVGFAYLGTDCFGTEEQYIELKMFHVSNGYRNNGIGKAIFLLICKDAKKLGVQKLYISAHSSKESQEAYTHLVCTFAKEINQQIAENEPCDVQMEYVL